MVLSGKSADKNRILEVWFRIGTEFDQGEDASIQVDWSKAKRPNVQVKRGNMDFPA